MAVMNAGTGAKGRGSVEEGRISAEVVGGGGWLCGEAATERGGFFFFADHDHNQTSNTSPGMRGFGKVFASRVGLPWQDT